MPNPQPLEEDVRERVKSRVTDAIEDGINNAWDRIEDPGGWVSGRLPGTATFPGVKEVAQASCRRWARGAGPQGPVADMTYRPVCEEYLDNIGELPGGGEYGPGFEGGQCAVWYEWSMTGLNGGGCAASTPFTTGGFAVGPISGPTSRPSGNPTFPIRIGVVGGDGVFVGGTKANSAECELGAGTFSIVRRLDGMPDNCGNPTGDAYTPTDYLPDDGGGTEPISLPGMPPFRIDIGPDGDINIDFPGFDGPGRSIDEPFVPRKPEDYGPQPEPPPVPGDRGDPDAPVDVGPGGDTSGHDPTRVLAGIKVTLTDISPKARVSFLGGDPYYSYAYSVLMGGDGGVERDNDSAFAPGVAFYHAPENSNRYSVAFRVGFGGSVVAYWKEVSQG